jgi:2-polyprenyl-6-methoxyphenol hydroxylase-like FAD-dependent oxidoreductase
VQLADGATVEGAVLVGADGMGSRVRQRILNPTEDNNDTRADCRKTGLGWGEDDALTFSGIVEDTRELGPLGEVAHPFETLAHGCRFTTVPLPGNALFWFATVPSDLCSSPPASLADVAHLFAGWHAPIPSLLASASRVRHERVIPVSASSPWFGGRGALIGDAAHGMGCTLAQGASVAIEVHTQHIHARMHHTS